MRQAVLRETLYVDVNHQLHIGVPANMGTEFEVILMPLHSKTVDKLNNDEQFILAAYSAVIENDLEEDAVLEKYVKSYSI